MGQEIEVSDRQGTEDVASRETVAEVLVPWDDPWEVLGDREGQDGQEDPWVCYRVGSWDQGPVGCSQRDPEVFQQTQVAGEDQLEEGP